jgi:hypothetical protein
LTGIAAPPNSTSRKDGATGELWTEDGGLESRHLWFLLRPLEADAAPEGDKVEGNTGAGGREGAAEATGEATEAAGEVAAGPGVGTGVGLEGGEAPGAGERGAERAISINISILCIFNLLYFSFFFTFAVSSPQTNSFFCHLASNEFPFLIKMLICSSDQ